MTGAPLGAAGARWLGRAASGRLRRGAESLPRRAGFRRGAAILLLLLALLPGYRLLATDGTGLAGAQTHDLAGQIAAYVWAGTLVLLLPALLFARFASWRSAESAVRRLGAVLDRPRPIVFSAACALAAFLLAWYVNQRVLSGQPNVIDAVTQLVQARYVAAGRLAGPTSELTAFWHLPLMVITPAGWVSQYPPLHVLLLGLGLRLGAVELVGPAVLALTVFFTSLTAHRLFPADTAVARLGTLLLALSPFAASHAAAYMNHTTAALCAALAVYAAVRLHQGAGWLAGLAVGLALGALLATRPLTAIVLGGLLAGAWLATRRAGGAIPVRVAVGATALGATVPVLLLMLYNARFFGSPFRFGYSAAFGPSVELGFGVDPWNNTYGIREAIGYTSADLTALNLFLLEVPLPIVGLIALYLLLAPRLAGPVRFLAAWALLPLAANALYWHHGLHMGPRMLNEYAPVWCLLAATAAAGLVRLAPAEIALVRNWSPRAFVLALFSAGWLFGLASGVPRRLASYHQDQWPPAAAAARLPEPSLVFVHGSWSTRVAMQLAGRGMRLDSLETIMQHNSTCKIQLWLDAGRGGEPLAFQEGGDSLRQVLINPDSRIRLRAREKLAPACQRQALADRLGVTEVGAFLWRAGLPGLARESTLFARDLGPAANLRLIRALKRPVYMLHVDTAGRPGLWPYEQAVRAIWGDGPAKVAERIADAPPQQRGAGT